MKWPARLATLLLGLALSGTFWVPALLIGPRDVLQGARESILGGGLPGGAAVGWLLLAFIVSLPVAGLSLIVASLRASGAAGPGGCGGGGG